MKKLFLSIMFILLFASTAMSTALQIDALWSGINNPATGKSYGGAIIATFEAGTSTPKAVWENKEQTLPSSLGKAQFTLDSNGQAFVFGNGLYKINIYAPTDTGLTNPLITIDGATYIISGGSGISLNDVYDCDLPTALAAIGSINKVQLNVDCDCIIADGTTETITDNISINIINGGSFDGVSGGGTETIILNGPLLSGIYQIFGENLTVAGDPKIESTYPEWWGITGDGVTDDSVAFTSCLDFSPGYKMIVSEASYVLNDRIYPPSNTSLYVAPGTTFIKVDQTDDKGWFNFPNVSDIKISAYGVEWKYQTKPTSSEFRHIFDLRGATNIVIEGAAANDGGGDGFYIGTATKEYCENIILRDVSADNNRRQGLSVISVKGLRVINSKFTNTSGTAPKAGIDLEPNASVAGCILEDIVFDNPYTEGNDGPGMVIALKGIANSTDKHVSIRINNHVDVGSFQSFAVYDVEVDTGELIGNILIDNPVWDTPQSAGFSSRNYDALAPKVEVRNPVVLNPNSLGGSTGKYYSAYVVFRESTDTGATNIGNVTFTDPTIIDDRAVPLVFNYFYIKDQTGVDIHNVNIDGNLVAEGITNANDYVDFFGSGRIEDAGNALVMEMADGSFTLAGSNYSRTITNTNITAERTITLDDMYPDWPMVTFEVTVAQFMRIDPSGTSHIYPGSNGVGKYIRSNEIGAKLTLQRKSATEWYIVEEIGTWVRQL